MIEKENEVPEVTAIEDLTVQETKTENVVGGTSTVVGGTSFGFGIEREMKEGSL